MFASIVHKSTPISYGPKTFAGSLSGTAGSNNGTGPAASFNNPTWIVSDRNGTYYISDTGNHTIRKMTNGGVVTTIFGTPGVSGSDSTHLNSPRGISVDYAGNMYVADYSNNRVFYIASGSSTGSNVGTISNVVQVAADTTGCNVIAMTNKFGKNMYQIRNGVIDGLINTSVTINSVIYDLNASSIAYSPSGSFYYGTTAGQFNNQVGMYRLGSLQAPSFLTTSASVTPYPNHAGQGFVTVGSSAGITPGMPFSFSGFKTGSYEDYNGYNGTVLAVNQSAGNNFSFKYIPYMKYPTAQPNSGATFSNSITNSGTSYSNILSIGWDNFIGAQTVGNLAPDDKTRLNFYFVDSNSVFPSIAVTSGTTLGGTTTLAGFSNSFSNYNGAYTTSTTTIGIYDAGYGGIGFIMSFTMGITSGASVTQQYTSLVGRSTRVSLAGYTLRGPGVPNDTIIVSDSYSGSDNFGTITINVPLTTTGAGYFVTNWPFSASRAVQIDFGPNVVPSAGGGTFNATIINNSSNALTINGAPYGYLVANIQFPPANISAFYASAQYGQGIQKYNLSGDSGTTGDSNMYAGNPSSFCVINFPTPELVTLVPTQTSNTIAMYSKSY